MISWKLAFRGCVSDLGFYAKRLQVVFQLWKVLHQNCPHSDLLSAFDILGTIIDEAGFLRIFLHEINGEAVNAFIRFAQTHVARADKQIENLRKFECANAILVQLARLVVDSRHDAFRRQRARKIQSFLLGSRLGEHISFEFLARKTSALVEDRTFEILVERHLSGFEVGNYLLMTGLKFIFLKMELLDCALAFLVVPGIAEQDAADVPKQGSNLPHVHSGN